MFGYLKKFQPFQECRVPDLRNYFAQFENWKLELLGCQFVFNTDDKFEKLFCIHCCLQRANGKQKSELDPDFP